MTPRISTTLGLGVTLATLAVALPLHAGPEGGTVVSGSATISTVGKNTTINTQSARTILEFSQFNIANSERVVFNQPDANSAVLNRVIGGQRSTIEGFLGSNGQVYVVNPAGVSFSPSAVVNVGRLVAAGANMDDADFLAGIDRFTDANGRVTNFTDNLFGNEGVVLVGKNVSNDGTISSADGTIVLVSGKDILLQDGPDGQIFIRLEGFGTTDARQSKLINRGTVDAGDNGQVFLGAGDLLGLSVFSSGQVEAGQVTLDTGDQPQLLSTDSSAFGNFSDDATITINTQQLSYHADNAPNDRLILNAPDGFINLDGDPNQGPSIVNGQPFPPGNPGDPGGPGNPGTPGDDLPESTFIDAYARFLPTEPLAVAAVSPATVDAGLVASLQNDLGIEVKDFDEQPLVEYLVAATVLNDLNLAPNAGASADAAGSGTTRVSANRLDFAAAQNAVGAFEDVFYVNSIVDEVTADQSAAAAGAAGVGDTAGANNAARSNADASADPTQQVRSMIQQASDRYMADAEVTEIDPVEFVEWLKQQDAETLDALTGLNELVNDAMPNLGLGAAEIENFKAWTYGKIAPQGVSLRTLDELVTAAGGL
ncbi:MAG: filamentous hemagglutinin N-terminal domain-containing protein [Planctomycetota bacterium]